MLDDRVVERLFGMVLAKLERPDEEFVSAKQLHGAGLERKDADPERRAPTLQAMYQSFQKLSGVFFCRKWREGGPIQFWKETWMRDAELDLMVV